MNETITSIFTLINVSYFKSVAAFVSGGFFWQLFKFFYPDIRRRIEGYQKAKKEFYENIDPILKSSDELYGKLFSLAKEDFALFVNEEHSKAEDIEHNKIYTYYLFCQFWAQLEFIRMKSQYSSITRVKEGKELLKFIEAYESRSFRVLDRSLQRMIGEMMIEESGDSFRVMSLNRFTSLYQDKPSTFRKVISSLQEKIDLVDDREVRQRILIFGVIVAKLIDHFDPKEKIVRRNKIYANKLNKKSKKAIEGRLFEYYLSFIKKKTLE